MNRKQKGFTLIELLVVIAIIAVLSVVVILTLNPAELLKQARDSNRISDLNTLKSALSLFLADTSSSTGLGTYASCYMGLSKAGSVSTSGCNSIFYITGTGAFTAWLTSTSNKVDNTGWIPVNFTAITSGSPLGALPLDPSNSAAASSSYYYRANPSSSTFKLAAYLESSKYGASNQNLAGNDNGNDAGAYEVGSDVKL